MGWEYFKRENGMTTRNIFTITILRSGNINEKSRASMHINKAVVDKYKIRENGFIKLAYDKRLKRIGIEPVPRNGEFAIPVNKECVFGITGLLNKYGLSVESVLGIYEPFKEFDEDAFIVIDLNKKIEKKK